MAGAYAQWGKDQHAQSARSTVKPPKPEQAIAAPPPPSAKDEAEAAAAPRREMRAAQQNAIAAQQDAERQADAARVASAKAEQQQVARQALIDEFPAGFTPAPRSSATDSQRIARAQEYLAFEAGNIAILLAELLESFREMLATTDRSKKAKKS